MHTDQQIYKQAGETVDLLFELSNYDLGKNVEVQVSLKHEGQNVNYIAVYTKKMIDGKAAWVPNSIRR
jgi:hypothetical protein